MFDETLKELVRADATGFLQAWFGVEAERVEDLPVEYPQTDARKVDAAWWVYPRGAQMPPKRKPRLLFPPPNNAPYVEHVEFQTENDLKMPLRVAQYHVRIANHCLDAYGFVPLVLHRVVYTGYKRLSTPAVYRNRNLSVEYELIQSRDLPADRFLQSSHPAVVLYAALSGHNRETSARHVRTILQRLSSFELSGDDMARYLGRLANLVRLRKIMVQDGFYAELKRYGLSKADVQRDAFYRDGLKEGIDIGIKEGKDIGLKEGMDRVLATAVNMVKNLGIDPQTAAQTAQIPVETLLAALQPHDDTGTNLSPSKKKTTQRQGKKH